MWISELQIQGFERRSFTGNAVFVIGTRFSHWKHGVRYWKRSILTGNTVSPTGNMKSESSRERTNCDVELRHYDAGNSRECQRTLKTTRLPTNADSR